MADDQIPRTAFYEINKRSVQGFVLSFFNKNIKNMNQREKQLQFHKNLATGLLILMFVIYISMVFLQKKHPEMSFIGYVKAFFEAAMVGALADWFAVTALFQKPMGLPIPHTNLIEERKADIGNNLGGFVVENFLKPKQIRSHIENIKVSKYIVEWLSKETTPEKIENIIKGMSLNVRASQMLVEFLDKGKHQELFNQLFQKIEVYISENQNMVRREIDNQFPPLIPSFIREAISEKVVDGLQEFVMKITRDEAHSVRREMTAQLYDFSEKLNSSEWENKITKLLKDNVNKQISEFKTNEEFQKKLDVWFQRTAYRFALRNKTKIGDFISDTVKNWEGKELSQKLEMEVGKDLQFIRINGTLVGGMVGLVIYALTQLL